MEYNITTVYTFQKKVPKNTKRHLSNLKKVIHFTDGAAIQNNIKNVINLVCHKKAFTLKQNGTSWLLLIKTGHVM
jgi:predicted ABC-type ATPase